MLWAARSGSLFCLMGTNSPTGLANWISLRTITSIASCIWWADRLTLKGGTDLCTPLIIDFYFAESFLRDAGLLCLAEGHYLHHLADHSEIMYTLTLKCQYCMALSQTWWVTSRGTFFMLLQIPLVFFKCVSNSQHVHQYQPWPNKEAVSKNTEAPPSECFIQSVTLGRKMSANSWDVNEMKLFHIALYQCHFLTEYEWSYWSQDSWKDA